MTPAAKPRTKKLRIALAINDKGDWCASGGATPRDEMESCFDFLHCCETASSASYWIEVEVFIPTGPSIIAATARRARR